MKYFLVMRQHGEGCDYTIGCGVRVDEIVADSLEEARMKAVQKVVGTGDGMETCYWDCTHETYLDSAILISGDVVDLAKTCDSVMQQRRSREELEQSAASQAAERAEFERLKAKFGA